MSDSAPQCLRRLLDRPGVLLAPGVVDALSARLAREAGFEAVFMGGNATTAVRLGTPDVGLMTLTEMADQAARIADAVDLPLVVDADTGYGNAMNVQRTVRQFARAGAAGLHMEDQSAPKRCGHFAGKTLISTAEMQAKIKAAVDARENPDFLIIARTDAIAVDGFGAALERAGAYAAAGADMLMFGPPAGMDEFARAKALGKPIVAILDTTGRTPVVPPGELAAAGVKLGIFPTALVMALIPVIRRVMKGLQAEGSVAGITDELAAFEDYNAVLDLAGFQELEERYAPRGE